MASLSPTSSISAAPWRGCSTTSTWRASSKGPLPQSRQARPPRSCRRKPRPPPPPPRRGPEPPTPSLGWEGGPACTEPWRDLYILRRGIRPCCYGGASLGGLEDYATASNSPLVHRIPHHLRP